MPDVLCDRCGRPPLDREGHAAPFSFCASCGLFVCVACWDASASRCSECEGKVTDEPQVAASASATTEAADAKVEEETGRTGVTSGRLRQSSRAAARPSSSGNGRRGSGTTTATRSGRATRQTPRSATPVVEIQAADRPMVDPAVQLVSVGPGVPERNGEAPPWARELPTPFVVRVANRLTEGRPFVLLLLLLIGITVSAGAWALGVTAGEPTREPVVIGGPDPTAEPSATPAARPTATPAPTAVEHRYVVRRGDTLQEIARIVYGDAERWEIILEANRDVIEDPDNLLIGTSLRIPKE